MRPTLPPAPGGEEAGDAAARFEAGPAAKAAVVERLRKEGRVVATESAGIMLVKGDLAGLVGARELSRHPAQHPPESLLGLRPQRSRRAHRGRSVYPFFGLLLSPLLANAAMSLSSVSVIASALPLRRQAMR